MQDGIPVIKGIYYITKLFSESFENPFNNKNTSCSNVACRGFQKTGKWCFIKIVMLQ